MVVLDFSIYPLDKGESVSPYVARAVEVVHRSGLDYRCHSMGTTVEGELDQLLGLIAQSFEALAADCNRIECIVKLDYRKGATGRLAGKVRSVESKLGHPVSK